MSKTDLVHDVYWNRYIDLVPEDDPVAVLEQQATELSSLLKGISEERSTFRYAAGKWSIKELVTHVADTERIFTYRAISIARGDTRSLPGFDEQLFAAHSDADLRPFKAIVDELLAVRAGTIALFRGLSDAAWQRVGTANDTRIGVRSLAFVAAGHVRHHMTVLRERYLKS
jgi:hypothetical protein